MKQSIPEVNEKKTISMKFIRSGAEVRESAFQEKDSEMVRKRKEYKKVSEFDT